MTRLRIPLWLLPVVFCIPPIVAHLGHRIRRRLHRVGDGQCKTCGYNLTGNISGICPECGTSV